MIKQDTRIALHLGPDLHDRMEKFCRENNTTVSKVVRGALSILFKHDEKVIEVLLQQRDVMQAEQEGLKRLIEEGLALVEKEKRMNEQLKATWIELRSQNEALRAGVYQQRNKRETGSPGTIILAPGNEKN